MYLVPTPHLLSLTPVDDDTIDEQSKSEADKETLLEAAEVVLDNVQPCAPMAQAMYIIIALLERPPSAVDGKASTILAFAKYFFWQAMSRVFKDALEVVAFFQLTVAKVAKFTDQFYFAVAENAEEHNELWQLMHPTRKTRKVDIGPPPMIVKPAWLYD